MIFGGVLGRRLQPLWRVRTLATQRQLKKQQKLQELLQVQRKEANLVEAQGWLKSYMHVQTTADGVALVQPGRAKVSALREYARKFGMMHVPRNYTFSATDESLQEELRGFSLYTEANLWRRLKTRRLLHRQDVVELTELGFEWDIRQAQYLTRKHQLTVYKDIYGDLNVPSLFRVPENAPKWPEPYWKLPLGSSVADMRRPKRALFRQHLGDMAKDLSLDISPRIGQRDADSMLTALRAYRAKHGNDAHIPQNYSVPDTEEWPILARNVKLGQIVKNFKYKKIYWKHREVLRSLGIRHIDDPPSEHGEKESL